MISIAQKEIAFNAFCRGMATDNLVLARQYAKDAVSDIFTRSMNNSKITLPSLKDRCINFKDGFIKFIKAFGLVARAPILCLPLVNRTTQLTLRLLSPKLSLDSVISSDFYKKDEIEVRYSQAAREQFAMNIFRSEFVGKKPVVDGKDLKVSKENATAFAKIGLNPNNCSTIFLSFLKKFPQITCNDSAQKKITSYLEK